MRHQVKLGFFPKMGGFKRFKMFKMFKMLNTLDFLNILNLLNLLNSEVSSFPIGCSLQNNNPRIIFTASPILSESPHTQLP